MIRLEDLLIVSTALFILCFGSYIIIVLKEKYYLKNNIIYIENKDISPELLEEVDMNHFMLGTTEIMAGDEVKIKLDGDGKVEGTVLGANRAGNSISVLTKTEGVRNLDIRSIKKLKIISRYGKFLKRF